jgi:SAM-dependent methyltransferase
MLVDELTAGGHCDVTVLDVSPAALDEAKQRGFADDTRVSWVVADVLAWKPTRHYAIWHDRAVFHFLVEPRDRALYVEQAASAIRPGGHLTVATFAADGPTECSGFAVCRYQPYELESIFSGDSFAPSSTGSFVHETPWLGHQPFTWVTLVRRP